MDHEHDDAEGAEEDEEERELEDEAELAVPLLHAMDEVEEDEEDDQNGPLVIRGPDASNPFSYLGAAQAALPDAPRPGARFIVAVVVVQPTWPPPPKRLPWRTAQTPWSSRT